MKADVLAPVLEVVADEAHRAEIPADPTGDDAVALHAAALRCAAETYRLARRIERARSRRWRLRRLLGRPPGQRR